MNTRTWTLDDLRKLRDGCWVDIKRGHIEWAAFEKQLLAAKPEAKTITCAEAGCTTCPAPAASPPALTCADVGCDCVDRAKAASPPAFCGGAALSEPCPWKPDPCPAHADRAVSPPAYSREPASPRCNNESFCPVRTTDPSGACPAHRFSVDRAKAVPRDAPALAPNCGEGEAAFSGQPGVPDGWKLGEGWLATGLGECPSKHIREDDRRIPAPFIHDDGRGYCRECAAIVGAIVPVEPSRPVTGEAKRGWEADNSRVGPVGQRLDVHGRCEVCGERVRDPGVSIPSCLCHVAPPAPGKHPGTPFACDRCGGGNRYGESNLCRLCMAAASPNAPAPVKPDCHKFGCATRKGPYACDCPIEIPQVDDEDVAPGKPDEARCRHCDEGLPLDGNFHIVHLVGGMRSDAQCMKTVGGKPDEAPHGVSVRVTGPLSTVTINGRPVTPPPPSQLEIADANGVAWRTRALAAESQLAALEAKLANMTELRQGTQRHCTRVEEIARGLSADVADLRAQLATRDSRIAELEAEVQRWKVGTQFVGDHNAAVAAAVDAERDRCLAYHRLSYEDDSDEAECETAMRLGTPAPTTER